MYAGVSPDGSVLDLTWIQSGVQGVTLNGPKGLALYGEGLYVADVDTLRVFDRRTGAPRRNVALPNPFAPKPLFLNDVVVGGDGTAYLRTIETTGSSSSIEVATPACSCLARSSEGPMGSSLIAEV